MVNAAKALLTAEKTKTNTHASIIRDFEALFVTAGKLDLGHSFSEKVLQLNRNAPDAAFANRYLDDAKTIIAQLEAYRKLELQEAWITGN